MVLHLLNYLLHVLTCVLQLGKLFLKPDVEWLELDEFLSLRHALNTCQKVVRHIVGRLKNMILLQVNLSHARVLNLIDRFFLFDELLDTAQTHVHSCDGLFDGHVRILKVALTGRSTLVTHLIRWRVSDATIEHHRLLMLGRTMRTKSLEVAHAKHIDRLVVFCANRVLNRIHGRSHLAGHHMRSALPWQIVTHFYLIALLVIDSGK